MTNPIEDPISITDIEKNGMRTHFYNEHVSYKINGRPRIEWLTDGKCVRKASNLSNLKVNSDYSDDEATLIWNTLDSALADKRGDSNAE